MNTLHDLDARIFQTAAAKARATTITAVGAVVLASQVVLRATAAPDSGASEAEQFGASIAEGIITALSAPLVYASTALLLVFGVASLVHKSRYRELLAERARFLHAAPQLPAPAWAPSQDRAWNR